MDSGRRDLPDGTYIELVRSLYLTLLPTAIMAVSFVAVGTIVSVESHDALLASLTIAGAVAAVGRAVVLLRYGPQAAAEGIDAADARRLERVFARPYLCFAVLMGLFGARALSVGSAESHALIVGLVFGYGAGVAAGLALRPKISVPSMVVAVVPAILAALASGSIALIAVGLLLAAFLGGGVNSMLTRYRSTVKETTMRRLMSTLARRDELTGLSNRLSLRERFDESRSVESGDMIAVHCLDLDRFKPVNDSFGHPIGDALLKAVSARLNSALRRSDFAARVGGDEFVVLQFGSDAATEAAAMAQRIARTIAQPYTIGGHAIVIGTSVGYALAGEHSRDLDQLLARADEALCAVKRDGGGIRFFGEAPVVELRRAA